MGPAPLPLRIVAPAAPSADAQPVGDPGDLDVLFRSYSRYVAAIALRVLGRDDEVDDVVQDVFLAAMSGLARLRSTEAIKGWLATVTVRHASRRLRRRRWRVLLGLDRVPCYEDVAAPGASPEERALLSRIYTLLDQLPVPERVAWTLQKVEGEQVERIAQLCGCSLATAKRRISAASQTIERMLGDADR